MFKVAHLTKNMVAQCLPKRENDSHKGTYGTVINIAGSFSYSGASYLSSISALKVGAGLVRLATNTSTIQSVSAISPDITYIDLGDSNYGTIPKNAIKILKDYDASVFSLGCGLDICPDTIDFVNNFIKDNINSQTPIIIDADGINILAQSRKPVLPLNSIITPHPMELSRLMGVDVETIQKDRVKWAYEASQRFDCIVLLKGYQTVIAIPTGDIYINTTGNSALAKAGMGDVLTGMIAGFASQGAKLEHAAILGAFIHGLAGQFGAKNNTQYCVLASNLISYIPVAIREVMSQ